MQALKDAASEVRAVASVDFARMLPRTLIEKIFRDNVADIGYQQLYPIIVLMKTIGMSDEDVRLIENRLTSDRLDDGTFRERAELMGSSVSTLYVLRLRTVRAGSVTSTPMIDSLQSYATIDSVKSDWRERMLVLGARVLAGDTSASRPLGELCSGPQSPLPSVITEDNVEGWAELTRVCMDGKQEVRPWSVTPWRSDAERDVFLQALYVNSISRNSETTQVDWFDVQAAVDELNHLVSTDGSTLTIATIALALIRSGNASQADVDKVRDVVDGRIGCANLPTLYRDDVNDQSCDLRASLAVSDFQVATTGRTS